MSWLLLWFQHHMRCVIAATTPMSNEVSLYQHRRSGCPQRSLHELGLPVTTLLTLDSYEKSPMAQILRSSMELPLQYGYESNECVESPGLLNTLIESVIYNHWITLKTGHFVSKSCQIRVKIVSFMCNLCHVYAIQTSMDSPS